MSKKTVVLGASPNPARYAFQAIHRLLAKGHEVVPVGIKKGEVAGLAILPAIPKDQAIDTVTLYIGPEHQPGWYADLLALRPRRIIFNPGTENLELARLATQAGIQTEEACTLVMLASQQY